MCLNMQMRHYLIKYALMCIHFKNKNLNFRFQNSCFIFFNILQSKVFRKEILDISIYHSTN